ncbi:M20 family peptidase [Romboutsia weinsteinii]|uniref:M20 family peptidase n=1 Tax=Romboutsia weinsteinii TaxID=2020949 RepID=A0A371J5Y6_9FIRM|nr:M20 family metallopeptidase [Romboutsia weinsteinii]RDY28088.1 M20 family peptidase [Romboutsia weinsteinii]
MNINMEKYLGELEELVNIDSGSKTPHGVEKVCDILYKKFEDIGLIVKKHYINDNAGPCLEVRNKEGKDIDILILGHMDTVFGEGTVKERPFSMRENIAYGPGVIDMKSALLSVYYVIKDVIEDNKIDKSICIAFNCDEEISSIYSRELLEELGRNSKYALVLEPARANGAFVASRKGVMKYKIDFSGVASHAGNNHKEGKSAIQELAHWVLKLHELTNYDLETTVNVGVVSGGSSANVVCPSASCEVDVRVKTIDEANRIDKCINELLNNINTDGVSVKVSGGLSRPPMEMTEKRRELHKLVEEIGKEEGINVHWTDAGGGSDGNIVASVGTPVIDAIGPIGGYGHNEKEYLEIDSVEPMARLLKKLIEKLS